MGLYLDVLQVPLGPLPPRNVRASAQQALADPARDLGTSRGIWRFSAEFCMSYKGLQRFFLNIRHPELALISALAALLHHYRSCKDMLSLHTLTSRLNKQDQT